jgi:hypothetical protein
MLLAQGFNSAVGDSRYKQEYDLNSDGAINIADVMIAASVFNTRI